MRVAALDTPSARRTRPHLSPSGAHHRTGHTTSFQIGDLTGTLTTSTAGDGTTAARIDLRVGTHGTTPAGLTDAHAAAASVALQHGVPCRRSPTNGSRHGLSRTAPPTTQILPARRPSRATSPDNSPSTSHPPATAPDHASRRSDRPTMTPPISQPREQLVALLKAGLSLAGGTSQHCKNSA
jgi:hypothetical protein